MNVMCLSVYYVLSMSAMYKCCVMFVVCCADVIDLVRLLFTTLTVAMRFEPANARFFVTEVLFSYLFSGGTLLQCFDSIGWITDRASTREKTSASRPLEMAVNVSGWSIV